jgi:hypothetical protein
MFLEFVVGGSLGDMTLGNPILGGTRPQTPAEGRLRPSDSLQKMFSIASPFGLLCLQVLLPFPCREGAGG